MVSRNAAAFRTQSEFDTVISRARKIRCDSTRPNCNNCVRRSDGCEYDEKPRRRGPDKRPGTRQRSCKKRPIDGSAPPPKRKKGTTEQLSEKGEDQQSTPKDASESSFDVDRSSPTVYHTHLHTHPSTSADDPRISEPNSHPKVCQSSLCSRVLITSLSQHELAPTHRRTSSYVYDQGSYINSLIFFQSDMISLPIYRFSTSCYPSYSFT